MAITGREFMSHTNKSCYIIRGYGHRNLYNEKQILSYLECWIYKCLSQENDRYIMYDECLDKYSHVRTVLPNSRNIPCMCI